MDKKLQFFNFWRSENTTFNSFTKLFENILNHPNIEVLLETDYFDVKKQYSNYEKIFYTPGLIACIIIFPATGSIASAKWSNDNYTKWFGGCIAWWSWI